MIFFGGLGHEITPSGYKIYWFFALFSSVFMASARILEQQKSTKMQWKHNENENLFQR